VDETTTFAAERPRLLRLAARMLADPAEAEDVVQQAWIRLHHSTAEIENLPAWLTTVTSRLCLDRLRARTPTPQAEIDVPGVAPDPADDLALAEAVGIALHVLLDQLTPKERVAFVLHDTFGFDFETIGQVLDTTTVAARKLASRARSKIGQPTPTDQSARWEIVDAFMAAARGGDFTRLLELLAPEALIVGDAAAVLAGTPAAIAGQHEVATFFNGAAAAALPVFIGDSPGAAWFHREQPRWCLISSSTTESWSASTFAPLLRCWRRSFVAMATWHAVDAWTVTPSVAESSYSQQAQFRALRTRRRGTIDEDHDLPGPRRLVRSGAPRRLRRRCHQGAKPPPQGGCQGW